MNGSSRNDVRPMTENAAKRWGAAIARSRLCLDHRAGRSDWANQARSKRFARYAANLAIGIEDKSQLGIGLSTEAIGLVLNYAFNDLKLHGISVRVIDYVSRAIRAYQKCGFTIEGKERETALVDGTWHDDVMRFGPQKHDRLGPA
jgi:hypothetical protein